MKIVDVILFHLVLVYRQAKHKQFCDNSIKDLSCLNINYSVCFQKTKFIKMIDFDQASRIGFLDTPTAFTLPTNVCPGYNINQSDIEAPVMLELWGMRSTPSLLSLQDPLRPRVVAPYRSYLWIKQSCLTFNVSAKKWLMLNWFDWNKTLII